MQLKLLPVILLVYAVVAASQKDIRSIAQEDESSNLSKGPLAEFNSLNLLDDSLADTSTHITDKPEPTEKPTDKPEPTEKPTDKPEPTEKPTDKPEPTEKPTDKPEPTEKPTDKPEPTEKPTDKPEPTEKPTDKPEPTEKPTDKPEPTEKPTDKPDPTEKPTDKPDPTEKPTDKPDPTEKPTDKPDPTEKPTDKPDPTEKPTDKPDPTEKPTDKPDPTEKPTDKPDPTEKPTDKPDPTEKPTDKPDPTEKPTDKPDPTGKPTDEPDPATTLPPKGWDEYPIHVPGDKGKPPCIFSKMNIKLKVTYENKKNENVTAEVVLPKTVKASGTCDETESKMILSWTNPAAFKNRYFESFDNVYAEEENSITFYFKKNTSNIAVDQIDLNIILDSKIFPDAKEPKLTTTVGKNLGLFATPSNSSKYICSQETTVSTDTGNVELSITDVSLIAFNEESDITQKTEENCLGVEPEAVSEPETANVGAIVGGVIAAVAVVGIIGFIIWRRKRNSYSQSDVP